MGIRGRLAAVGAVNVVKVVDVVGFGRGVGGRVDLGEAEESLDELRVSASSVEE